MTKEAKREIEKANSNQIIAIDPGSEKSALIWWNGESENISNKGILENHRVLEMLQEIPNTVHRLPILVIEKVTSYGMPVGASVFDTVFISGRFWEAWHHFVGTSCHMLPRMEVKMHLCHNSRAKDSNIRQALIDRFEPDLEPRQRPKGILKGIKADTWSALALAVTYFDLHNRD